MRFVSGGQIQVIVPQQFRGLPDCECGGTSRSPLISDNDGKGNINEVSVAGLKRISFVRFEIIVEIIDKTFVS